MQSTNENHFNGHNTVKNIQEPLEFRSIFPLTSYKIDVSDSDQFKLKANLSLYYSFYRIIWNSENKKNNKCLTNKDPKHNRNKRIKEK